jgi:DNA-binding MarR family transcriptional regulator
MASTSSQHKKTNDKSLHVKLDLNVLESLIGYNARRAALYIIDDFNAHLRETALKPVEFSVLSAIAHNANISAHLICKALNILPPNIVGILKSLEERKLITRVIGVVDNRQISLAITRHGQALIKKAQQLAMESDLRATTSISAQERAQLIALLKKIYQA